MGAQECWRPRGWPACGHQSCHLSCPVLFPPERSSCRPAPVTWQWVLPRARALKRDIYMSHSCPPAKCQPIEVTVTTMESCSTSSPNPAQKSQSKPWDMGRQKSGEEMLGLVAQQCVVSARSGRERQRGNRRPPQPRRLLPHCCLPGPGPWLSPLSRPCVLVLCWCICLPGGTAPCTFPGDVHGLLVNEV